MPEINTEGKLEIEVLAECKPLLNGRVNSVHPDLDLG